MYLPLILFFISLVAITVMIWHKVVLLRNGQVLTVEGTHPFAGELEKIKKLTFKNIKKLSIILLFIILKVFIKSSNFLKIKSLSILRYIKRKLIKESKDLDNEIGRKEASKYLKIISEYRHRIRQMKHMIRKEEGIE